MKVLLSAYACEAGRGSEPGVGWNIAWELAKEHQVWVLTRPDDGRPAIESYLAENPNSNLHFVYFTLPVIGGFWKLGSIAFVFHYYLWQIQAYFVARKLHREVGFDVAHHVTFVRYSTPSFISLLPIPFIWGTVGGGEMAPKSFWQDFSWRAKVYEILRVLAHRVGELDPFTRITAQRSRVVRVTTEDTAERVRLLGAQQVEVVPETSLPTEEIEQLSRCPMPDPSKLRFISMGRLLHWKGFYLGIRAFAAANLPDAEYWILGDGVEMQNFQRLAQELGVGDRVKFWGNLPRSETLERLGECHVLVHPSLHDSGGWVCLESMAAGRPILCLDLGGPGVQVTKETGIKVLAHTPEQAVKDLAYAMKQLALDPDSRIEMGKTGQQLIQSKYNWERKGKELSELYQRVLNT
ncbi:glycosyltransferase family 4 protein [Lyngbya confervoides]|uniref:Glycosyltransferase n=1 Tax=Lyngbya confervoides BDU141951 TaxID=1574623 RepID=A0ABD4T8S4_9CYAN|nr:glycosyltransferase [Lyngbya confervoides]MCM1984898.1 glycosyltransferase [Lyngbya confervoides BDU141951]